MDILQPELIWVDGRCYRFLDSEIWSSNRGVAPYIEENYEADCDEEELSTMDMEIVPLEGDRFQHTFHVPKPFFPCIIGSKHATRKRIAIETKTHIQIPTLGQDGDIVITGSNREGIVSARHRIDLLIETSRKRLSFTHFLSIPLNEGHIIMKYNSFKNDVLKNCGKKARGMDESLFQTPSKLHLTIGVLTLLDDIERNRAIAALDHCKEHVIKPILEKHKQIKICLEGIEIMNDDPAEVNVLYAKVVDADNSLQELADQMVEYYSSIGLLSKRTSNPVKLHVTLMNTKFREQDEESKECSTEKYDATDILKTHKNISFGETILRQIHISQRGTIGSNGYYQSTAKINLLGD